MNKETSNPSPEAAKDAIPHPAGSPPAKEAKAEVKPSAGSPASPAERLRPTNCVQCNKRLIHHRWYYRNGQHYCTKRCWRKRHEEARTAAAAGGKS